MFDQLQIQGQCCGINDWSDFSETPWAEMEENTYFMVPDTCCKMSSMQRSHKRSHISALNRVDYTECKTGNNMELIYDSGCYSVVKNNITNSIQDIKVSFTEIGLTFSFVLFQIISIILIGLMVLQLMCSVLVFVSWKNVRKNPSPQKTVIVRL